MMDVLRAKRCAAGLLALTLCGCSSVFQLQRQLWTNRYGPDTEIEGTTFSPAITHQRDVLMKLAAVGYADPDKGPMALNWEQDSRWTLVAEAGYNYVDEACDLYLQDLFIAERQRDRTKNELNLLNTATAAILGTSLDKGRAANDAIKNLAQSFNLAIGLSDTLFNSYLFSQNSGTIFNVVHALRTTYRKQALANGLPTGGRNPPPAAITTGPAAYQSVRAYLQLCMPPRIEAEMNKYVTKASAAVVTGDGSSPPVVLRDTASDGTRPPASAADRIINVELQPQ